jgi:pilus assembly protein CpaD
MGRYRSYGESRSRLVVDVPVGSTNETAAIVAAKDIRQLGDEAGLSPNAILISKYRAARDTDATIKISFLRTAAHGPECGSWPTNLADQPDNANYDNFGCAQQHNLAAMIANPSDLVTPQGATPTSGERRGVIWEKYIKGESTVAAKSASEQVSTTSK